MGGVSQEEAVPRDQSTQVRRSAPIFHSYEDYQEYHHQHEDQFKTLSITVREEQVKRVQTLINKFLLEDKEKRTNQKSWYQPSSSGATLIKTPFDCLFKRCSLSLFSHSGQDSPVGHLALIAAVTMIVVLTWAVLAAP